jgi:hypothetical protein
VQISQLLPFLVLPHKGRTDEGMVTAITQVLISGKFIGDTRCSAGMNIIHYLALQPDLLTHESNIMLRLLKLIVKMKPDVNGQVCNLSPHQRMHSSVTAR